MTDQNPAPTTLTGFDAARSTLAETHPGLLTPAGHLSTSPDTIQDVDDLKDALDSDTIQGYHELTFTNEPRHPLGGFRTHITSRPSAYDWDVTLRSASTKFGATPTSAIRHLIGMVLSYWAVPQPYRPFAMDEFEIFIGSDAHSALAAEDIAVGDIVSKLTDLPEHTAPEWMHHAWDVHKRQRGQQKHHEAEARSLKRYLLELPATDGIPAWARVQSIDSIVTLIERMQPDPERDCQSPAYKRIRNYCNERYTEARAEFPRI